MLLTYSFTQIGTVANYALNGIYSKCLEQIPNNMTYQLSSEKSLIFGILQLVINTNL